MVLLECREGVPAILEFGGLSKPFWNLLEALFTPKIPDSRFQFPRFSDPRTDALETGNCILWKFGALDRPIARPYSVHSRATYEQAAPQAGRLPAWQAAEATAAEADQVRVPD